MTGRPKKPTKLKLVQGTLRKSRTNENEPEPEPVAEVPRPPSYLSKYAKKLWKSLAEELVEKGILTIVDLPALEVCCEAYGQYRAAQEAVFRPVDPKTGKRSSSRRKDRVCSRASICRENCSCCVTGRNVSIMYLQCCHHRGRFILLA